LYHSRPEKERRIFVMLKVFVNTWRNYNENGADGGEYIELPMDEEELEAKLVELAEALGDEDPEYAIHDYEWMHEIDLGEVHEMDSIVTWNERCQEAADLDGYDRYAIAAAMEAFGYDFDEALERQQRGCFTFYPDKDLEEVGFEIVNDCYFTKDTPDIFTRYFDYAAFARDLGYDGYTETQYGVILDD
jgi:antirestriction protein